MKITLRSELIEQKYIKYECIELRDALDCLAKHARKENLCARSLSKSDYVRSKILEIKIFLRNQVTIIQNEFESV